MGVGGEDRVVVEYYGEVMRWVGWFRRACVR